MNDIREVTEATTALYNKAQIWIDTKYVERKSVTIGQLARSLRVPVTQALTIVRTLSDYNARLNQTDKVWLALSVFVNDSKLPDWMKQIISPITYHRLRRAADKRYNRVIDQQVLQQALAHKYGSRLKKHVRDNTEYAAQFTIDALLSAGIDRVPPHNKVISNLDYMDNPEWYLGSTFDGFNSNRGCLTSFKMEDGTQVRVEYGRFTSQAIDDAAGDNQVTFKTSTKNHWVTQDELDGYLTKVDNLVKEMRSKGYDYLLVGGIYAGIKDKKPNFDFYATMVFTRQDELGLSIAITFPWKDIKVQEV